MKIKNLKLTSPIPLTNKPTPNIPIQLSHLNKRRNRIFPKNQSKNDIINPNTRQSSLNTHSVYTIYEEHPNSLSNPSSHPNNDKIQSLALTYIKKPRRTYQENQVLISYLFNLSPFNQIISESAGKESEDIIRTLSYSLKYEYIKQNNLVFKYGDISDKYYLILKGQVDMIVPNEEEVELSEIEYYDYLLKLREYNEMSILNKVIAKNNASFNISENSFDIWVKKAYNTLKVLRYGVRLRTLKEMGKRNKERKQTTPPHRRRDNLSMPFDISINEQLPSKKDRRQSMMTTMKSNYVFMQYDSNDNNNNNNDHNSIYIKNNYNTLPNENSNNIDDIYTIFNTPALRNLTLKLENQIIRTINAIDPLLKEEQELFPNFNEANFISQTSFINNTPTEWYVNRTKPIKYQFDSSVRKSVIITTYFPANSLKTGETFGEMVFDINQNNTLPTRVVSVITSENCHFGTLNKQAYDKCLREVSEKTRKAKLNYFFKLDLFKTCDRNLFMKNFYNFFTKKTMTHPQILFNQNEHVDIANRRIYFIRDGEFSSTCNISLNEINKLLIKYNYDKIIPIEDIENESFKHKKMNYIVLDEKRQELFNNKHKVKLQFFRENDIIGLDDCVFEGKYLYDCKCNSIAATVYEIHIHYFKMMLTMDSNIRERVKMQENIKRNLMVKMLLKYKRTRIDLFNYKDNKILYNNNNNNNKHTKNKALMTIKSQFGLEEKEKTKNAETFQFSKYVSSNASITITNNTQINDNMSNSVRKSSPSRNTILSKTIIDTFKLNKQKGYMCLNNNNNTLSTDKYNKTRTNVFENTFLRSKCDNSTINSVRSQIVSNYNITANNKKDRDKYAFPALKKKLPLKVTNNSESKNVQSLVNYNTITNDFGINLKKKYSRNKKSCSLYPVTQTNVKESDDEDVKEINNYERYMINCNNSKVLLPCKPSMYLSGKKTRGLLNTLPGFFYSNTNEPKNVLNINKKGMFMSSFKSEYNL